MSDADRVRGGEALERAVSAGRSNLLMAPVLLLAGFGATIAVARSLGPADFAIFAAAIAFRGLVGFLGDLGAGTAATRLFSDLQARDAGGQARRAYLRLAALRLPAVVLVVGVLLLAPDPIADLLTLEGDERHVVRLLALIAAFEITATLGTSVLAGLFAHRQLNRLTLVATLVQPAVVVVAVLLGGGLGWMVAGVACGSAVRSLGGNALAVLALRKVHDGGVAVEAVARTYVSVASGAIAGKVAAILHQRQILTFAGLSAFTRPEVAAFALAYDFALQALNAIANPIYSLLLPGLTAVREDRDRTQRTFAFVTRGLALAVLPLAVTAAVLFDDVVGTLFGAQYDDATRYGLLFLLAFAVEIVLAGPVASLMLADPALAKAYRTNKLLTAAAVVLYLPLLSWSLLAASAVMMGVRLSSAIAMHVTVARRTGLTAFGAWVLPTAAVVLAAGAGAALPWLIGVDGAARLVTGSALAAVAALLAVRAAKPLAAEDVTLLERALPQAGPLLRRLQP